MNDRTLDAPAALEQELEAPPAALALWRDAALALGATGAQAAEAARTGVIALECRDIAAAFSDGDGALVLSTALPATWLDDAATRRDALRASVPLMVRSGVTIARTATGPALLCRWSIGDRRAPAFAAWLREFAALANLVTVAVPRLAGLTAAASVTPSRSSFAEAARS
jgi:hypothetical protein